MTVVADTPAVVGDPAAQGPPRKPDRWLLALFVGFPLWWALGLGDLSFILAAIPMAYKLGRRRRIKLPPGFGAWLLLLVWIMVSLVMLGENPTGVVNESFSHRLLPYVLRLAQYLSATVVLLYIGNLSEFELPRRRLIRMLSVLFGWTVLGGLLGTVDPTFQFTSPVEKLLPASVAQNIFVQSLVHPSAAQLQKVLGFATPRPSAPFGYTNTWGNNYAVLLVWFVVAALVLSRRTETKVLALGFLAISALPVVHSLNRGLWVGLGVSVLYLAYRLAAQRRPGLAIGVAVTVGAVLAVVLATSLGSLIDQRASTAGGKSNALRIFTTKGAIAVVRQSPFLGFGSTRNALGSPQSISVGKSPACPRCGNVALGSNGQIWLLLVSQGLIGAALYVYFFLYSMWRYRRDHSPVGLAGTLVLLLALVFSPVYNAMGSPIVLYLMAAALLWRNDQARQLEGADAHRDAPVTDGGLPSRQASLDAAPAG